MPTRQSNGIANGKAVPASRSATTRLLRQSRTRPRRARDFRVVNRANELEARGAQRQPNGQLARALGAAGELQVRDVRAADGQNRHRDTQEERDDHETSVGASPGPKPCGRTTTRAFGRVAEKRHLDAMRGHLQLRLRVGPRGARRESSDTAEPDRGLAAARRATIARVRAAARTAVHSPMPSSKSTGWSPREARRGDADNRRLIVR